MLIIGDYGELPYGKSSGQVVGAVERRQMRQWRGMIEKVAKLSLYERLR